MKRKAICFEGTGCFLTNDDFNGKYEIPRPERLTIKNTEPFPYGNGEPRDTIFKEVDYQKLKSAMDQAFEQPDVQKTRSVLVAYKNQIVAERYLEGFDENSKFGGVEHDQKCYGYLVRYTIVSKQT